MSIFANTNNPGNLTDPGGAILYPNQTGSYTSANGFTYAVFASVQDGYNALVDYVQRNLAAYPTPSAFVQHYLGTSTPNSANPNPAGYQATIGPAILSGDPNAIATAISKAEGSSLSGVNTASTAAPTSLLSEFGGVLNNAMLGMEFTAQNGVPAALGVATGITQPTTAQANAAGAAAQKDTGALNPLPWIKTGGLIVLGVLLVGIAAFLLARGGKALSN